MHRDASEEVKEQVRCALAEDIGSGDVTAALISPSAISQASVISRETAVLCGADWFNRVFAELDCSVSINWHARDADLIAPNQLVCSLVGPARALLSGERTALNFLQTLSGTATLARKYADAVKGTRVKVLDTRKTLPGLRSAQKYAVSCGGCYNHRHGLYDGVLIKENHILAMGSLSAAVHQARETAPPGMLLEVEVETLSQVAEALAAGVGRLLLDNFTLQDLKSAVEMVYGQAELEASGGITLDNIRAVAETGIDYISVGELTKSVTAIDLSMRFRAKH